MNRLIMLAGVALVAVGAYADEAITTVIKRGRPWSVLLSRKTDGNDHDTRLGEDVLQNVTLEAPPWYLTFAVKNQTQLDNVLSAVSADTPIVIDIQGAGKNQITVPEGRKVAILAKSGWTFGAKPNGLTITFK